MRILSALEAKQEFGRLLKPCAEPVVVEEHRRLVAVMLAVEAFEPLVGRSVCPSEKKSGDER